MPKTKPFSQLTENLNADPARRARVEEHKRVMLSELRRSLKLTQTDLASQLHVSQRGVSHIENEPNPRLSTLADYVVALGGHLELRAVFDEEAVELVLPLVLRATAEPATHAPSAQASAERLRASEQLRTQLE